MSSAVRKHWCLLGLIAVFIVGVPFAAQAQFYTKYYEFGSATPQIGVDATLFGFEYITATYSDPWGTGTWGFGTPLPYTTGINWTGAPTQNAAVGFTTWDMSAFLWDLRWAGGDPIMPTASAGAPGGGVFVWDDENATWTICNTLLAPDPQGNNHSGDLSGDNAAPPRPTIYFPSHLDLWVFDSAPDFGQIGGYVGPMYTPGFSTAQVLQGGPTHYNVEDLLANGLPSSLGPGECLQIPMPNFHPGQSLLLTGPMLDDRGDPVGYYGEMVNTTPEPCTLILLACSALPLLGRLWRRRK